MSKLVMAAWFSLSRSLSGVIHAIFICLGRQPCVASGQVQPEPRLALEAVE